MVTTNEEEFGRPKGLDFNGKVAYETIMKRLKAGESEDYPLSTGGCRTFYSHQEWKERGEQYGLKAVLIVVYDGGDVRPYFNMDASYEGECMMREFLAENGLDKPSAPTHSMCESMQEALNAIGMHYEECTGWYAAVYKD